MKKKVKKTAVKKPVAKKSVKKVVAKKPVKKVALNNKSSGARKPISIRVLVSDIQAIKSKASKMGIPYQTYLNIIIHREATGS